MYIVELKTIIGIAFIDLDKMFGACYYPRSYQTGQKARFLIQVFNNEASYNYDFTGKAIKPAMDAVREYAVLTRTRKVTLS